MDDPTQVEASAASTWVGSSGFRPWRSTWVGSSGDVHRGALV